MLTLHSDFVAVRRLTKIRGPREYNKDMLRSTTLLASQFDVSQRGAVLVGVDELMGLVQFAG